MVLLLISVCECCVCLLLSAGVTLVPSAPKQFAALCGAMFTAGAAICFFKESDSARAGGAVIMGVLLGCALLEGLFNVCVACVMFKLGLGSLNLEASAVATRDEYEKTWMEEETDLHEPIPDCELKLSNKAMGPDGGMAMNGGRELVYRYKASTDGMKRENWSPIKQMRLHYFNCNLGLTGLALVFYYSSQPAAFAHPNYIWKALAIAAGIMFGLTLILYTLRALLNPRKVAREWAHPVMRSQFCAIPLNILLFVPFAAEYAGGGLGVAAADAGELVFARVLFWVAAPALLFLTIVLVSLWITRPFDQDLYAPALFYPVLANVVASLMLPLVRADYVEGAWLFFSFSAFMWFISTTQMFNKLMHHSPLDDRARSGITFLFANPLMLFTAYTTIQSVSASQQVAGLPYQLDAAAYVLYWTGIVFFLINVLLVVQAYYGRQRFDMSYWGFSFPLCVLAIATMQYMSLRNTPLTQGIATAAICIAAYIIAILAANTVTALLSKKIFTAWSEQPPAILKLQHYALIECADSLSRQLNKGVFSVQQVQRVQEQWTDFLALHEQHSDMEDHDAFPLLERVFPGITSTAQQQHHELDERLAAVTKAMQQLHTAHFKASSEDEKRVQCSAVGQVVSAFLAALIPHLDEEIFHVTPVMRKHISLEQSKRMVRNAWDRIDMDLWRRAIPATLRFQYNHARRIRFLAQLRAALPDQMTTIAKIVFEGCDRLLYERLCVDIPELRVRETAVGLMHKVW